jgi:hypothetical protein
VIVKAEMSCQAASLYLVESGLGLAKLGVAPDPKQRLRELQVGSPVRLTLALSAPYPSRAEARAVAAELARRFAARRAHGSWFRVTRAEVDRALTSAAVRAAPGRAERTGASAAGEAPNVERTARKRTEKERAYQRRRRREQAGLQKRAARLLAGGMTQRSAAAAVGVTTRTLRNWSSSPAFTRAAERERERTRVGSARTTSSGRQQEPNGQELERVDERTPEQAPPPRPTRSAARSGARSPRSRPGSYEHWLDEHDARLPGRPDPPIRLVTESGKTVGRTSASNAERMAAALEPTHGPLTIVPA